MKKLRLTIFLLSIFSLSYAQHGEADSSREFHAFVQKIQQAYQQAHYLGFNIRYYYANADRPGVILDSLMGQIRMDKGRSSFSLAGTETVLTDNYSIQINNDERAIYLAPAHRVVSGNPMSMLDSVFAHIGGIRNTVRHEHNRDIMTLLFPPGQAYSRLEIQIDNQSGLFQRLVYSVNTATVAGNEMISRPDNPSPYQSKGRMEILFTDYQQGGFDDKVFNEGNFFNKLAVGRFEAAGRYRDYHIFLASSNL